MNYIDVMKQALEALKFSYNACDSEWVQDEKIDPAIAALEAAFMQLSRRTTCCWRRRMHSDSR